MRHRAPTSPGQALWNQRETISTLRDRFEKLSAAVGRSSDLHLYQWVEFAAFALEFSPDLIIELGRGFGNSTCCFIEVAHRLGGPGACRVLSLCTSDSWFVHTEPQLRNVVPSEWFAPAQIESQNIVQYDPKLVLANAKKVLVFWDAHGFDIAEWVFCKLLPQLIGKPHVVMVHDMSDNRFEGTGPVYGEQTIWTGTDPTIWRGKKSIVPLFWLGHITSNVPQAISIVDFTSRNRLPLHSAAESLNSEIVMNPSRLAELRTILGDALFSAQAHWYWFTLNEGRSSPSFPRYAGVDSRSVEELTNQIAALQRELHERNQKFDEEIALLTEQKRTLETNWDAVQSSTSWTLLNKWRHIRNRFLPERSWPRKLYDRALGSLRGHSTDY